LAATFSVAKASLVTQALVTVSIFLAIGVRTARFRLAFDFLHRLTFGKGVAEETRRTRALRQPIDHLTLSVDATDTRFKTRVLALATVAFFVVLAVVVGLTFVLVTLLGRFSLESVWAQT
jgi:hypothetical protein